MTIVAPFGFYGWGNIGDESTLQGFARLVNLRRPPVSVWVASRNPAHTRRVEPSFRYFNVERAGFRGRWAHRRARAAVFAGGTPVMDGLGSWPLSEVAPLVESAHERHQPVAFVGVGTERLDRRESRDIVANVLAPRVEHWTVRSEHDKERLVAWRVPADRVTVAADLAWLLRREPDDFGRTVLGELNVSAGEPLIGVNVNNERVVLERDARFFEKMAEFLDRSVETYGARVLFFCSEIREGSSFDKFAAHKVLSLMRMADRATVVPNRYWTPQELLSIIACCRLTVSMRYHVCLFSAIQGVPFVAIRRSDKVTDLCSDISWPFGVSLDDVEVSTLLDHVCDIDRRRESLACVLHRATEQQAARSLVNQVGLDAITDCLEKERAH